MSIRNSIQALKEEITAYRRAMHENPQTAYEEKFASGLVADKLKEWGIEFQSGIATTGIVATIKGQKNSGRTIGLRADMDALDILEEKNKPWISKTPGKMHGCGHDGHTAMLLGAAKYLNDTKNFDGTVHLIFQPAEEGANGAATMIKEGLFKKFPCDAVFGLHNWPGLPRGTIAMRPGPIMAAADRFSITLRGKGGHAAMPNLTIDPIVVASHIVTALQTLVSRSVDPVDTAVISVTNLNAGTGAFNVIPETATLSGTLRSFKPETRKFLTARITEMTRDIARSFGAEAVCKFTEGYDPTVNSPKETAFCASIARKIAKNVDDNVEPCMGAEDFGAMLAERPGCYIWMGQAEPDSASNHNKGLHTPQYDFNDEIIPLGIEYWARVVEESLPLAK
jgi:hippurate hydrolase